MMGKYKPILFSVVAANIFLSACIAQQTFEQSWRSGLLDADDLEDRGISMSIDESCLPPCWQGLTPGESTTEEVLETLNQETTIDSESIKLFSSDDESETIVNWDSSLSRNQIYGGSLRINDDTLIFVEIVLEYELTMSEIIQHLGEPELYEVVPNGPDTSRWAIRFMWPGYGFVAESQLIRSGTSVKPDVLVKRVAYFPPGQDARSYLISKGFSAQTANRYSIYFKPWEGFEDFVLP